MGLQLPKCWVTLRGNEGGREGARFSGESQLCTPRCRQRGGNSTVRPGCTRSGVGFCCLKLTGVWFCVHILRELLQCQGSQERKGYWLDHSPGEQSRGQDKARTQGWDGTVTSTWFPLLSSFCSCFMASGLISSFSLRKQEQLESFIQLTEQAGYLEGLLSRMNLALMEAFPTPRPSLQS